MKYNIGDRVVIKGVEGKVIMVNVYGAAYIAAMDDGEKYNNIPLYRGLVFAVIDRKGFDKLGNKASFVTNKSYRDV